MTKILLIEDNLEIRENTVETLELAGYNVVAASNGKEGVIMAEAHSPHVILCDIQMPEMNGYEVFRKLKDNELTSAIPFVFVTASAEKKEMQAAISMGADGYVCKPFDAEDLFNEVKRVLGKSGHN